MSGTAREIASLAADVAFSFSVFRTSGLLDPCNAVLREVVDHRPSMFLISPTIAQLHGDELTAYLESSFPERTPAQLVVTTGEHNKSFAAAEKVLAFAEAMQFSRRGVFVGIGGGILLDIVGFAASMFHRGIAHVKVGTTLVAQIDAAIGVKCGVNLRTAKNVAGAFHAPERVVTDSAFLTTLPERQIRCGLAEMIKLAVVHDGRLFEAIERDFGAMLYRGRTSSVADALVDDAIIAMLDELRSDIFEGNLQRAVDFGHTISPRLETTSGFSVMHGEAVAIDIAVSCVVSNFLGLLPARDLERLLLLFDLVGLPRWHELLETPDFLELALASTVAHRGMKLNMPLPTRIGEVTFLEEVDDLPHGVFSEAVAALRG